MSSSVSFLKSVKICLKSLSNQWTLSFFLVIVGRFTGILSSLWALWFLFLVAVLYFMVHPEVRKARAVTKSPPGISTMEVVRYLYSFCKTKTSRRILFMNAVVGACLWFAKEGVYSITVGTKRFAVLHNPDATESLLSSNACLRKGIMYKLLKPLLGEGLITSEGRKWHERRRIITPTFHFKILDTFIPVFDRKAKLLVRNVEDLTRNQGSIDIVPLASQCTMDVILETALGKSMNTQEMHCNEYVDALARLTKIIYNRIISPWSWGDFIFHRTEEGKTCRKIIGIIENFVREVISERKVDRLEKLRSQETVSFDNDIGRKSKVQLALLDLLVDMHLKDNSISLQDIAEEVATFINAGYHTTAAAISWTLYLLGLHGAVQIQVQEELDLVLGEDSNKIITLEDIKKLKYLLCVLKESMRLYPPVPLFARTADEDITINGYKISKGTSCSVLTYAVHRNPEIYPNPEKFNPDRFNQENSKTRHAFAYIPFSAGPRNCIGQRFAMNEAITILATMLRHFSVTSMEHRDKIKLVDDIVLMSEEGLHLKFSKRRSLGSYSL